MLQLTAADVARATGATFLEEATGGKAEVRDAQLSRTVADVVIDSRQVHEGSLFVCIKGERVDGNEYAVAAVKAGAAAVVLTSDIVDVSPNLLCGLPSRSAARCCAPRATMPRSSCCAWQARGESAIPSGPWWA
jgi:UDP-N-acetylmuramyl pentapeptide synthase